MNISSFLGNLKFHHPQLFVHIPSPSVWTLAYDAHPPDIMGSSKNLLQDNLFQCSCLSIWNLYKEIPPTFPLNAAEYPVAFTVLPSVVLQKKTFRLIYFMITDSPMSLNPPNSHMSVHIKGHILTAKIKPVHNSVRSFNADFVQIQEATWTTLSLFHLSFQINF